MNSFLLWLHRFLGYPIGMQKAASLAIHALNEKLYIKSATARCNSYHLTWKRYECVACNGDEQYSIWIGDYGEIKKVELMDNMYFWKRLMS